MEFIIKIFDFPQAVMDESKDIMVLLHTRRCEACKKMSNIYRVSCNGPDLILFTSTLFDKTA